MWHCVCIPLLISSVPSAPLDLTVTCTGPTSFNITWFGPASANGVLLHYNVYFGSFNNNELKMHEVTADQRTIFSFTNLTPNMFYTVEVSAATQIGGGPGTMLYVLIDHGIAFPSPSSFVSAETVNSTAVKLSWGYPEYESGLTIHLAGYIIYHNVTSEGQLNVDFSDLNSTGSHTHVFEGLMPSTYYWGGGRFK